MSFMITHKYHTDSGKFLMEVDFFKFPQPFKD